jgi:polyhydroxyalkanoate synthesis regulator phasin
MHRGLAEELINAGEGQWKEFEKSFLEAVQRSLATMHVASRSDVGKLRTKIDDLEKRILNLEARKSG